MEIIYDDKLRIYEIKIEYPETEICISTDDLFYAREEFIKRMTWLFNNTVCQKFIKNINVDSVDSSFAVKMCQSESDHEWECCGISTGGTSYICKKCRTRKVYPI